MAMSSSGFIKNYVLHKLLNTRLYFLRENTEVTDFIQKVKRVKKILIILPRDRAQEVEARRYIPELRQAFPRAGISTLDILSLRKNDVNWLGVPNTFFLNKFRTENFEMIIDINDRHDALCSYLAAFIGAPMRIHLVQGKFDKIYNLHFRASSDTSFAGRFNNMIGSLNKMKKA
jgi:hypothetical protein